MGFFVILLIFVLLHRLARILLLASILFSGTGSDLPPVASMRILFMSAEIPLLVNLDLANLRGVREGFISGFINHQSEVIRSHWLDLRPVDFRLLVAGYVEHFMFLSVDMHRAIETYRIISRR